VTKCIEKAHMMLRVPYKRWMDDKRFNELMEMLGNNKPAVDELSLFLSNVHPPLALDEVERRSLVLKERISRVNKEGFSCGVNILATVGHHEENAPGLLDGPYARATDINGNICKGSFCPNDPAFLDQYVKELYLLIARIHPDHIWIDDDVRFNQHMPAGTTCFCDNCLKIFSKETGARYTRETLTSAFNEGDIADKLKLRKMWIKHNRDTIDRLFGLIEETVHGVDGSIILGFMTGERFCEGYDFDTWAETLSGPVGKEILWRPGGGFYEDQDLSGMMVKSHEIGRQVSLLPASITGIYSEIENFFYQKLKKSAKTTTVEIASHIAAGCTGAAVNVLSDDYDLKRDHGELIARIAENRPFYDMLSGLFGRSGAYGIWAGWRKDSWSCSNMIQGDWVTRHFYPSHTLEMNEIGLPQAYGYDQSCVSALSGEEPYALGRDHIINLLSRGVYLDGGALTALNEMGFGKYTGFKVTGYFDAECIEEFSSHPLNGEFAGTLRDCRQSFYKVPAATLESTSDGAFTLSRMIDYGNREKASCCLGIYENELGGRICVAGYFPWSYMHNISKSTQVKNIMRWISRDTIPAYVSSLHKATLWVRKTRDGGWALAVLNCSLDPAEDLEIKVLTCEKQIRITDMKMSCTLSALSGEDGPYHVFRIPFIASWEMCAAVVGG
jgi:hypothetical protein